jgi:hypothetical protein
MQATNERLRWALGRFSSPQNRFELSRGPCSNVQDGVEFSVSESVLSRRTISVVLYPHNRAVHSCALAGLRIAEVRVETEH